MNINKFNTGAIRTNTYLVSRGSRGFVVDPSYDAEGIRRIEDFAAENSIEIEAVLLTHGHVDHCGGVGLLSKKTPCFMCGHDLFLSSRAAFYARGIGMSALDCVPDKLIYAAAKGGLGGGKNENADAGGQGAVEFEYLFSVCGLEAGVVFTPGHTPGSVCYFFEDTVFTGDTLFKMSVGRTDFEGGDADALRLSLKKLCSLERNYNLLPGHGRSTTLSFEKENNFYLSSLDSRDTK